MDSNKASITRVHDTMLGGKDNYAEDRAVRDRLLAIDPQFPLAAQDARQFQGRAVRYLAAHAGVRQFLDCGACLPTAENTHEIALRVNPDSSVVYASKDPMVLTYARALLADNDRTHVAEVNVSRAERVLADPVVSKYLDFDQPIGLLHVLTLHHVPDKHDPWAAMAQYIDALAPGSYVVMAHMLDPGPGHELAGTIARIGEVYRSGIGSGWPRTAERILDLLRGLELLEPGLVPVGDWWPDGPPAHPPAPMRRLFVGAVARKP
ncbi:hypothetical protein DMH04_33790 [Kibdelosporangium aridum]|uniref:S-adenosyl methyltransferase n=1 Tax=Kibdelosporangium aridum TaxID=2030 RepID=A0A428Z0Q4_KIBAR|nr:SAM-dependent methyltransferase [Kibdelosporangium aridum]RSM78135.1 hypothetical protein DMH04_33790 [Kibdelosporangium aridum]